MSADLESSSTETLVTALRQLCGRENVTAVTVRCVTLAGHPNDEVRMWAAEALERSIQPIAQELFPLIDQLERSSDGEVSYWAATMLGRLGTDAAPAATVLTGCLEKSPYLPARERAAWALCHIGPAAQSARSALIRTEQTATPRLRKLAREALRRLPHAA